MDLNQFNTIGSIPSDVVELQHELLTEHKLRLWIKREDLIHPIISGNKWRKLKYHIQEYINQESKRIVSLGGAFSNHLHALAYAGHYLGFPTHGIIHGYNIDWKNPTLLDCMNWGMTFEEVDKERFHYYQQNSDACVDQKSDYFVPMGGTDSIGIRGVIEMADEINSFEHKMDVIAVPFGSGGTMAGLIIGLEKATNILGFSSFSGQWESKEMESLLSIFNKTNVNWEIINAYRIKGFAKYNSSLLEFLSWFQQNFGMPLDHIYNGKMMYGIWDMIGKGKFQRGSNILAIHTGGLQGRRGLS